MSSCHSPSLCECSNSWFEKMEPCRSATFPIGGGRHGPRLPRHITTGLAEQATALLVERPPINIEINGSRYQRPRRHVPIPVLADVGHSIRQNICDMNGHLQEGHHAGAISSEFAGQDYRPSPDMSGLQKFPAPPSDPECAPSLLNTILRLYLGEMAIFF